MKFGYDAKLKSTRCINWDSMQTAPKHYKVSNGKKSAQKVEMMHRAYCARQLCLLQISKMTTDGETATVTYLIRLYSCCLHADDFDASLNTAR